MFFSHIFGGFFSIWISKFPAKYPVVASTTNFEVYRNFSLVPWPKDARGHHSFTKVQHQNIETNLVANIYLSLGGADKFTTYFKKDISKAVFCELVKMIC